MKNPTPQELCLKLMEITSFNEFCGKAVVQSLRLHKDLRKAAYFTRAKYNPLIPLRDMADGIFNADTLFLIPAEGKKTELEALAGKWNADEIDYLSSKEADEMLGSWPSRTDVLRVWWD